MVRGRKTPDYYYFERTRNGQNDDPAKNKIELNGEQVNSFEIKSTPTVDESPATTQNRQFLELLFGQTAPNKQSMDPLSIFIAQRMSNLLANPTELLQELPVMPQSISTLLTLLNDPEFEVSQLVTVIENEPSMAADVIKLANVLCPTNNGKEITDLKKAFMTMGAQGLFENIILFYVNKFTPPPNAYFKVFGEKLWLHSQQTAHLSRRLLESNDANSATAYFVGLIRNLGKMVIFQLLVEAFSHVNPDATPGTLAFKKLIQKYATVLTLKIAEYWEMPKAIRLALALQESSRLKEFEIATAVFEANKISEINMLLQAKKITPNEAHERIKIFLFSEKSKQIAKDYIFQP